MRRVRPITWSRSTSRCAGWASSCGATAPASWTRYALSSRVSAATTSRPAKARTSQPDTVAASIRASDLGRPSPTGMNSRPSWTSTATWSGTIAATWSGSRFVHPERAPIWLRIFDLAEAGHNPNEIKAILNGEGAAGSLALGDPARRGPPRRFARAAQSVLRRPRSGLRPAHRGRARWLIEPERWERIAARSSRPLSRAGHPSKHASAYLLRRVLTCGACGEALYSAISQPVVTTSAGCP